MSAEAPVKSNKMALATILVLVLVVGFLGGYVYTLSVQLKDLESRLSSTAVVGPAGGVSLSDLFEKISPSVVSITVSTSVEGLMAERAQGSGFVYDTKGHIVTNNHVIEGATKIRVTFWDGTEVWGKVAGADPYSDLAVVEVKGMEGKLRPLMLGNSTSVRVGDPVVAVGSPFGLSGSITTGIVSAKGRLLRSEGGYSIPDIIQVDAAINPGNSGGPLLTYAGVVIGITTAIQSRTGTFSGIGFAVASELMRKEIPVLADQGEYRHAWVGIAGMDLNLELAQTLNLTATKGFLVTDVVKDGPASKAGMKAGSTTVAYGGRELKGGGDIIVGIDGSPVNKLDDLITYLELRKRPGDAVDFTVIRDGANRTVTVTLGERPPPGIR